MGETFDSAGCAGRARSGGEIERQLFARRVIEKVDADAIFAGGAEAFDVRNASSETPLGSLPRGDLFGHPEADGDLFAFFEFSAGGEIGAANGDVEGFDAVLVIAGIVAGEALDPHGNTHDETGGLAAFALHGRPPVEKQSWEGDPNQNGTARGHIGNQVNTRFALDLAR